MKHLILVCLILSFTQFLDAQHVHLQTFTVVNRTAYTLSDLKPAETYYSYGARLALGLPKLQIGGEFERQFNDPSFTLDSLGNREQFDTDYYGGFLRFNVSQYPAHRFGLVLKAGAGIQNTTIHAFDSTAVLTESIVYPDPVPVFHAGIGFSIPIYRLVHFDFQYQFNFASRPALKDIPSYTAAHHSMQLGISINLVFGNALKKAKEDLPKWKAG